MPAEQIYQSLEAADHTSAQPIIPAKVEKY